MTTEAAKQYVHCKYNEKRKIRLVLLFSCPREKRKLNFVLRSTAFSVSVEKDCSTRCMLGSLTCSTASIWCPISRSPFQIEVDLGPIRHILQNVRTDDSSGTNFRPGQTNIKGSDGLPLRRAVLEQRANLH